MTPTGWFISPVYQHEPHQSRHGPMQWGHAVSFDLVGWQHFPIALAPDALGDIWSGSGSPLAFVLF